MKDFLVITPQNLISVTGDESSENRNVSASSQATPDLQLRCAACYLCVAHSHDFTCMPLEVQINRHQKP